MHELDLNCGSLKSVKRCDQNVRVQPDLSPPHSCLVPRQSFGLRQIWLYMLEHVLRSVGSFVPQEPPSTTDMFQFPQSARQARLVRDSGGILGSCAPLPRPKGLPALVALRARPLRGCCSLCSCSLSCPTVPPHGLSLGLRPRLSAIRRSIGTRQATCGAKLRPRPSAWLRATPGMGGLRPGNARSLRESTF